MLDASDNTGCTSCLCGWLCEKNYTEACTICSENQTNVDGISFDDIQITNYYPRRVYAWTATQVTSCNRHSPYLTTAQIWLVAQPDACGTVIRVSAWTARPHKYCTKVTYYPTIRNFGIRQKPSTDDCEVVFDWNDDEDDDIWRNMEICNVILILLCTCTIAHAHALD